MNRSLALAFCLFLSVLSLFGQFENSEVLGTVTDASGSPEQVREIYPELIAAPLPNAFADPPPSLAGSDIYNYGGCSFHRAFYFWRGRLAKVFLYSDGAVPNAVATRGLPYVLLGVEESRRRAKDLYAEAVAALDGLRHRHHYCQYAHDQPSWYGRGPGISRIWSQR